MSYNLINPHGDVLVNLIVNQKRKEELEGRSKNFVFWNLTPRQLCDLELLLNGAFSPLRGFLTREDYETVCREMRLMDGTFWPIPITLDIDEQTAKTLKSSSLLALCNFEGAMLAVLHIEDIWKPNLLKEAKQIYGTTNIEHPGVAYLLQNSNPYYIGGRLEGIQLPQHYDFKKLRLTPAEQRKRFAYLGWKRIIAFQTRNPMHRAHLALTINSMKEYEANLLIHPIVGITKPGDVDHYTRVRCYQAILKKYPKNTIMLSLLPLAMRMAGPRESLWHAIIRKNYGCTHFIVGRDHAGPGSDSQGRPFYNPYDAHEMLQDLKDDLGIQIASFKNLVYVKEQNVFLPEDELPEKSKIYSLSGTELRERLDKGLNIPSWFSYPEIIKELRRTYPPRKKRGFTVFFTGLPGSGKSTIAKILIIKLLEIGGRPITFLDGDIVRKHISSELGFSKEDRDINIRRIGFVASEITKNGGIAICAPIAPYDKVRKEVRKMIDTKGGFILVHLATSLSICEQRDPKGLYKKARAGKIKQFTGISDPYEEPDDAEIVIDTNSKTPEECAQKIIYTLEKEGFISLDDKQ